MLTSEQIEILSSLDNTMTYGTSGRTRIDTSQLKQLNETINAADEKLKQINKTIWEINKPNEQGKFPPQKPEYALKLKQLNTDRDNLTKQLYDLKNDRSQQSAPGLALLAACTEGEKAVDALKESLKNAEENGDDNAVKSLRQQLLSEPLKQKKIQSEALINKIFTAIIIGLRDKTNAINYNYAINASLLLNLCCNKILESDTSNLIRSMTNNVLLKFKEQTSDKLLKKSIDTFINQKYGLVFFNANPETPRQSLQRIFMMLALDKQILTQHISTHQTEAPMMKKM